MKLFSKTEKKPYSGILFLLSRIFFLLFILLYCGNIFAETLVKEGTYYADSFSGSFTAYGDIYSHTQYSAAICSIPLGQFVYVSKGGTGVVVRINDRPNCSKYPDVIDLSQEVFRQFASLSVGRISDLQVTPLGLSPANTTKGYLPRNAFRHLDIELSEDIPTILFTKEGITIKGRTLSPSDYVILYFAHEKNGYSMSRLIRVSQDNTFRAHVRLPDLAGNYTFILAKGKSFNTDKYSFISLIDEESLAYPSLATKQFRYNPKIVNQDGVGVVEFPENMSSEAVVRQSNNRYTFRGKSLIFSDINLKEGPAQIQMSGYFLSTASPLDRAIRIPSFFSGSVILDRIRETPGLDKVFVRLKNNIANIRFIVPSDVKIRSKYYLTLADGSVREQTFASGYIAGDNYLIPNTVIQLKIPFSSTGTYVFEVVAQDGIAYINVPIRYGPVWPIIQPLKDTEIRTMRKNKDTVVSSVFSEINELRLSVKVPPVQLDPTLTKLAQAKVDDMIARGYQGHLDPDGLYIDGFAKKRNFSLNTTLAENIGYGNVSDLALQYGLEESGSHRYTMLSSEFTKVGIGYAINKDKAYLVHVFGN